MVETSRNGLVGWLFAPVDAASLAVARVLYGLAMLVECALLWLRAPGLFHEPTFHFTYLGFGWVRPFGAVGTRVELVVMAVAALCIALGLGYRLACVVFGAGLTHLFLVDVSNFMNHFYLMCVLAFLFALVPAHARFSLDARLRPAAIASATVPRWALALIRFQVAMPYVFGGLAKVSPDWLAGWPMRGWLAVSTDFPVLGRWFGEEWMVHAASWGAMSFDLLVVPALLWRRTRPFAYAVAIAFHVFNGLLFSIGIFPWLMMALSTIYFDPAWPLRGPLRRFRRAAEPGADGEAAPAMGGTRDVAPLGPARTALLVALALHATVQIAVPLRHLAYPGVPGWTHEGVLFAWRMKLHDKYGTARFAVRRDGGPWSKVDPREELTRRQYLHLTASPDLVLQYAHHLADRARAEGATEVEVRAAVRSTLDHRPPATLIDPAVDLAAERRGLHPYRWVRPLTGELPSPEEFRIRIRRGPRSPAGVAPTPAAPRR